jgi:haloalkane dehalogenase
MSLQLPMVYDERAVEPATQAEAYGTRDDLRRPTSYYIWRNIIPFVATPGYARPDLDGMGQSRQSPAGAYRFSTTLGCLDAGWTGSACPERDSILFVHDWGGALGFQWARRHPDRVQGIAYMGTIVHPRSWHDFPHGRDAILSDPTLCQEGEKMVLDENFFGETVLPRSILRTLTAEV